MTDIIPLVSYAVGVIMLFGAGLYAIQNYRITRGISRYWLIYAIGMFIGGTEALVIFVEYAVGTNELLASLRAGLASMFAISLVVVAVEMITTDIAKILE